MEKLISLKEAAKMVGITQYAVRKAIKDGFVSYTCFDDAKNSKMWVQPSVFLKEIACMKFKKVCSNDSSFDTDDKEIRADGNDSTLANLFNAKE